MTDLLAVLGVVVGGIFTLLVFSYLLGDTPLFRFAQAVFVGVTIGYATTVAVHLVLLPYLFYPLADDLQGYVLILIWPLLGGILLLLKLRPSWGAFGNIPIGFLFGVGSALAIGGALSGALWPQLGATLVSFSPRQNADTFVNNLILFVGTIGALLSFRFVTGGDRPAVRVLDALARRWGYVGRWFILIAFGAIFASTAVSRISILVSRVYYLLHDVVPLVP
jgi:hypothetical protein